MRLSAFVWACLLVPVSLVVAGIIPIESRDDHGSCKPTCERSGQDVGHCVEERGGGMTGHNGGNCCCCDLDHDGHHGHQDGHHGHDDGNNHDDHGDPNNHHGHGDGNNHHGHDEDHGHNDKDHGHNDNGHNDNMNNGHNDDKGNCHHRDDNDHRNGNHNHNGCHNGDGQDGHGPDNGTGGNGDGDNNGQGPDDSATKDTPLVYPPWITNTSLIDLVNSGVILAGNYTSPQLNGDLPALQNESFPATSFGGIAVEGANETHRPLQGTNAHAIVFRGTRGTRRFNGTDADSVRLGNRQAIPGDPASPAVNPFIFGHPATQPDLPLVNPDPNLRCEYKYESVLGGSGATKKGALWALEGYVDLVAADVMQGGIGDCGLGAAVMALAAGGWTKYLKAMFKGHPPSTPGGAYTIDAVFHKDGQTTTTTIDDQLPVLQNFNPFCWPYPGFQPVLDAAEPGPDGSYPPTPIFFMPLLEKAFAKFLDANPDWKSAPSTAVGYDALEGVDAHRALAAITGGKPRVVWRTQSGDDPAIAQAVATCMTGVAPCVIGTTNSTTLFGMGTTDQFGSIWLNPAGDTGVPAQYNPGTTTGLAAPGGPKSPSLYTVLDFCQILHLPPDGKEASTAINMVGNHAYAFEWKRSFSRPSVRDSRLRILNPWGVNSPQWPGSPPLGDFDDPSEVTYSLPVFLETIALVYTVTDIPPLP